LNDTGLKPGHYKVKTVRAGGMTEREREEEPTLSKTERDRAPSPHKQSRHIGHLPNTS